MNTVQRSLVYIKKEQITIMMKEILHIKHILIFYKGDNDAYNDMTISFNNIKKVERKLKELKNHLKILETDSISENYPKFILLYDYIGRHIHESLQIVELIYQRVNQIFEEAYNQYIPRPTLGRRFSNNNLMVALKKNYQEIISTLSNSESDLVLSWSFKNYFQLEYAHDKFTDNSSDKYGNYINLPYWYYELPLLLPSITHECGRVVLLQQDNKINHLKVSLNTKVNEFLNKQSISSTFIKEENILKKSSRLVDKVISDIIGFIIYDKAYIYSIFHDTIGLGIAGLFEFQEKEKIKQKRDVYPLKDKGNDEFNHIFDMKMSSWRFSKRRDITIIRLHILLSLLSDNDKDSRDIEMQNLLNSIMLMDKNNRDEFSFADIYKGHPHYTDTYQSYAKAYRDIISLVLDWIRDTKVKETLYGIVNQKETSFFKEIFLELWDGRFKKLEEAKPKILHKNEFRKLLHKNRIKKIERATGCKEGSLGDPFALTFTKLQKNITCDNLKICTKEESCLDCHINDESNKFKEDNSHCFGIYDLFKCKPTKDYEDIDNQLEGLEEKLDHQNQQDRESTSSSKPTERIKYYESKFSLMQIYPTILGTLKDQTLKVDLLYNIELNRRKEGDYLYDAIIEIAKKLEDVKSLFSSADIFKSLGPKDIIVYVKGVSSQDLLGLNPKISSLSCTKRTFTTVLSELDDKKNITPAKDYNIVSYLRIKHYSNDSFKKKFIDIIDRSKEKKYIKEVLLISGVLDIQIIWKKGTSIEEIVKLYNRFMRENLVTDFQTKFNKKLWVGE